MKFLLSLLLLALTFPSCVQNGQETEETPVDPVKVTPLTIGSTVPSIELQDPYGNAKNIAALSTQKTLFVFYRGGWCPFCSAELSEIASIKDEIREKGIHIVGISPDQPEYLRETLDKMETDYLLLSDSRMEASKAFGIAFKVDPETVQKLKENGMDIEKRSGMEHKLLPVPAVFLVNAQGIIEFHYVNPDYKKRIDKEILMAAVEAMAES